MKKLLSVFVLIAALGPGAAPAVEPVTPDESQPLVDEDTVDTVLPDDVRFYCRAVYYRRSGRREVYVGSSRRSQERAAEKALESCRMSVRNPHRCELRRCWQEFQE